MTLSANQKLGGDHTGAFKGSFQKERNTREEVFVSFQTSFGEDTGAIFSQPVFVLTFLLNPRSLSRFPCKWLKNGFVSLVSGFGVGSLCSVLSFKIKTSPLPSVLLNLHNISYKKLLYSQGTFSLRE